MPEDTPDLFGFAPDRGAEGPARSRVGLELEASLDGAAHRIEFTWRERGGTTVVARGVVECKPEPGFGFYPIEWKLETGGRKVGDHSTFDASSIHARLRSWRKLLPVEEADVTMVLGKPPAGQTWRGLPDAWKQLGTAIYRLLLPLEEVAREKSRSWFQSLGQAPASFPLPSTEWAFQIESHESEGLVGLVWRRHGETAPSWLVSIGLAESGRLCVALRRELKGAEDQGILAQQGECGSRASPGALP